MADFKSQNEIATHQNTNFFRPGAAEVALYFLISAILLLVTNSGSIIKTLGGNEVGSPSQLKASFSNFASGFSNSFSSALGGRLGQIILWAFVGALTYIGLWLAKNVLNSFENDIISAHYLHPSSYDKVGYWTSSLSMKVFLGGLSLISVTYIFILIKSLLPTFAVMIGSAAYHFEWRNSPIYIVFALIGMTLAVYVGIVLLRLTFHLWKRL